MVSVRYIVDDVDAAVDFYTTHVGFELKMHPAPGFAMLSRGSLVLLLNAPGAGGGGQPMADGTAQAPGGWSRFQIEVDDLEGTVARLREAGVTFRGDVIVGRGGRQALLQDPAGNLVEIFQA